MDPARVPEMPGVVESGAVGMATGGVGGALDVYVANLHPARALLLAGDGEYFRGRDTFSAWGEGQAHLVARPMSNGEVWKA